jgi:hypothetical protein
MNTAETNCIWVRDLTYGRASRQTGGLCSRVRYNKDFNFPNGPWCYGITRSRTGRRSDHVETLPDEAGLTRAFIRPRPSGAALPGQAATGSAAVAGATIA